MYKFTKRLIDIIIALLALVILSPILIITIIILLLTGEHEIFFKQKRIGYKGRPFHILKFATMLKNSSNTGTGIITVRNDPRVTPVGKFLRMSKINELPQIYNVLKGEMSIVGPRPLMEISYLLYPENIRDKVYKTKPGITGIGSIIFRDEEKIISEADDPQEAYQTIFPYKADLEIWYLNNQSLMTDFRIIFLTALTIVAPNNNLREKFFPDLPKQPEWPSLFN